MDAVILVVTIASWVAGEAKIWYDMIMFFIFHTKWWAKWAIRLGDTRQWKLVLLDRLISNLVMDSCQELIFLKMKISDTPPKINSSNLKIDG